MKHFEDSPVLPEIKIPIRIVSEANKSEHWSKKSKRHKIQKMLIRSYMNRLRLPIDLPCKVKLTRIAPKEYDYDNLCVAFKWCFDAICDILIPGLSPGRADADPRICVEYFQEKGQPKEYAIKIEIEIITRQRILHHDSD